MAIARGVLFVQLRLCFRVCMMDQDQRQTSACPDWSSDVVLHAALQLCLHGGRHMRFCCRVPRIERLQRLALRKRGLLKQAQVMTHPRMQADRTVLHLRLQSGSSCQPSVAMRSD